MRNFILGAAALALTGLAPLATSTKARAEITYAWCGYARDIGSTCSFVTEGQCRAWVSGSAGDCYINPRLVANGATRTRR